MATNFKKILTDINAPYLKTGITVFRPGDTVKVHVKVVEGESERVQPFEGVVIAKKNSGLTETFTVRKISFGIGVERTFPLHSPRIVKIELIKSGRARRAKLYYLRKLSGKAARLSEKEDLDQTHVAAETAQPAKAEASAPGTPKKKGDPEPASLPK